MAIKGKKISEELKKEAKKFKITLTEMKKGGRTYKTEAKIAKEVAKAKAERAKAEKVKPDSAKKEAKEEAKEEKAKEENTSSTKLTKEAVSAFNSDALSVSRNANQLIEAAEKAFEGLDVKVDKFNNKQIRFIVEGTTIPAQGYYTTK